MNNKDTIAANDALYIRICRQLISDIKSGKLLPGSRLPSERQLAESVGISRGTARLAIQELAKAGFIEKRDITGSYISSRVNNRLVKVLFLTTVQKISREFQHYVNYQHISEIYRGMLAACGDGSAQLIYRSCPQYLANAAAAKLARELSAANDGIVITSDIPANLRTELVKTGVPVMTFDEPAMPGEIAICYNRREICRQLAEKLVAGGCRTCGFLRQTPAEDRVTGKEKIAALTAGHLQLLPQWDIVFDTGQPEVLSRNLPQKPENLPDVFIAFAPLHGMLFLKEAFKRNWRIPQDVSVVGYGNIPSEISPLAPLTYIRIPHYEIGKMAVDLIVDHVQRNRELPAEIILNASIIHGETAITGKTDKMVS